MSGLERLSAAATAAFDPQAVLNDLLRVVQDLLRVDRAWLLSPCDPDAAEVRILAEAAVPGCPGEPLFDRTIPMDDPLRRLIRSALNASDPLQDPDPSAVPMLGGRFAPRSRLMVAVCPEGDRPSLLGLHQCRVERTWSEDDLTLVRALAGRLAAILDNLAVRRALTESEERFRATFEQAAVGICHRDPQGFFLRVNRKLCDILGYNRHALFRVGRISTMGEMSSAIAHEVAQPLMGISTYAGGALERIDSAPTEVEPLRLALREIARLAERAGRIRYGSPSPIAGAVRCLPSRCRRISRVIRASGRPRVWPIARSTARRTQPSKARNEP